MKRIREFSDVLKEIRGAASQGEMARRLGITQAYYSELERGKKIPSVSMMRSFSEKVNKPLSYLMGETEINENYELKSKVTIDGNPQPNNENYIEIPLLTISEISTLLTKDGLPSDVSKLTKNILLVEASIFAYVDIDQRPFAVSIEGDSMAGAGLEEGSKAIINPAEDVTSGDSALVYCDGDLLIKWIVYNPDDSVDLQPANFNYNVRRIESRYAKDPLWFRVIGKVVEIVRKSKPKRAF